MMRNQTSQIRQFFFPDIFTPWIRPKWQERGIWLIVSWIPDLSDLPLWLEFTSDTCSLWLCFEFCTRVLHQSFAPETGLVDYVTIHWLNTWFTIGIKDSIVWTTTAASNNLDLYKDLPNRWHTQVTKYKTFSSYLHSVLKLASVSCTHTEYLE